MNREQCYAMADVLEAKAQQLQATINRWPGAFDENRAHQVAYDVLMGLRDGYTAAANHTSSGAP